LSTGFTQYSKKKKKKERNKIKEKEKNKRKTEFSQKKKIEQHSAQFGQGHSTLCSTGCTCHTCRGLTHAY
jgi:ferredoxin